MSDLPNWRRSVGAKRAHWVPHIEWGWTAVCGVALDEGHEPNKQLRPKCKRCLLVKTWSANTQAAALVPRAKRKVKSYGGEP
jgi:hypothetical protein